MNFDALLDSNIFTWVIMPLLIFLSRIIDVSVGTLRIIFVSRGKKYLAPLLGFVEVSIWVLAITQVMNNLNNIPCFLAFAAGFAAGNYVGMLIEEKLALGMLVVRIILVEDECMLTRRLTNAGYGITVINARGANGEVKLIYSIIKRKNLNKVVNIIDTCNSKAFYSVEDIRGVNKGIFPVNKPFTPNKKKFLKRKIIRPFRKGK